MTFNKKFLLAGAALSGVVLAGAFFATKSQAATSNLIIDAVVIEALTLSCTTPLDFGTLDASGAGVVTISTAGARSSTNAANLIGGSTPNAGVCVIDGEATRVVDLNIPNATLANTTTPGDTLAVGNYTVGGTAVTGGPGNDFDVTLQAGAGENLTIGGDLTIVGGEDPGVYQDTITVTATYQ